MTYCEPLFVVTDDSRLTEFRAIMLNFPPPQSYLQSSAKLCIVLNVCLYRFSVHLPDVRATHGSSAA